jgi:hypothetical protein
VDWWDGESGSLTGDTIHTYSQAGEYTIILSLSGSNRWTFSSASKPLLPKQDTTVTNVEIISMPSLEEWFGNSATSVESYFFSYFNYNW